MNCSLQNILHINLHILYYSSQDKLKIQELQESINYIKSYKENKIEFLDRLYFQFIFHLNFKLSQVSGESITQCKCESHANVNPR